jgi:hypothetical protein
LKSGHISSHNTSKAAFDIGFKSGLPKHYGFKSGSNLVTLPAVSIPTISQQEKTKREKIKFKSKGILNNGNHHVSQSRFK